MGSPSLGPQVENYDSCVFGSNGQPRASPYGSNGQMTMMLHNCRYGQLHTTLKEKIRPKVSGPWASLYWSNRQPWASVYGSNGQMTMMLHNSKSRHFLRILNNKNPSSSLGDALWPMGKYIWGQWAFEHDVAQLQAFTIAKNFECKKSVQRLQRYAFCKVWTLLLADLRSF